MARVQIVFEDTVGGPMDGSAHMSFESDPPFLVQEDGTPVVERLSLAQKQGLIAISAVDSHFNVLDARLTKFPFEEEEQHGD